MVPTVVLAESSREDSPAFRVQAWPVSKCVGSKPERSSRMSCRDTL
jgi:hypothetical protein